MNVLEQVHNDVRTPDKLIDGENDTMDGRHMWLAPILPGVVSVSSLVSIERFAAVLKIVLHILMSSSNGYSAAWCLCYPLRFLSIRLKSVI